jgi:hypothetical protein
MNLSVEIWNINKSAEHSILVSLYLFFFLNIQAIKDNAKQSRILLTNRFIEQRPAIFISDLAISTGSKQKTNTFQVFLVTMG